MSKIEHDLDDPPPSAVWTHWDYFNRWCEYMAACARLFGLLAAVMLLAPMVARAHDLPGIPTENQAWYQNAETNPEARPTFPHPWVMCCNHAELIPVKDIIFPNDSHGWQWNDQGVVKNIPDVITHWGSAAPDNQPTLFVYLGVMTCFYPPQGGA